jgi:hypothetical protein
MRQLILLILISLTVLQVHATSVRASSFGYDTTNATGAFQAAISSNYDTVIIDWQSADWKVSSNHFWDISNKTILFEPGVVLRAIPGQFPEPGQCLFRLSRCQNITIIGYGATFIMNKAEYVALGDSEYRHTLSINNCTDIRIYGLTLRDSGGDGIYVGGAKGSGEERPYCENILIEDVRSINHYRQGMSITSVENMTVRHCLFTRTNGTLPEAGVDVEPYETYQRIVNLNFDHCIFTKNNWVGLCLALSFLDSTSLPVSIRVSDCFFSQNSRPGHPYSPAELFVSADKTHPVQGDVVFDRCTIDSSQWTLLYTRKTAAAYALTFRDCVFKDVSLNQDQQYNEPIFMEVPDYTNPCAALGGIHFDNVLLTYPTPFHFMRVYGWETLEGVHDITGRLTILAPQGDSIWLQKVAETQNLSLHYSLIDSLPATTITLENLQNTAIECDSTPAVFNAIRHSEDISYPISIRYLTTGTATEADDIHLQTGALVLPADTIRRNDSLFARNDNKTESVESVEVLPLQSTLYQVSNVPLSFDITDCRSNAMRTIQDNKQDIRVCPNPVHDNFEILSSFPWTEIVIYTGAGKYIRSFNAADLLCVVDLPVGIYILQFYDEHNMYLQSIPLVKQ